MSCIGSDCFNVRQEAQNPSPVVEFSNECSPDQVGRLQQEANQKILAAATESRDTCPEGCRCVPKPGAKPEVTDWETVPVEPFTLTDGNCVFKVKEGSTVETRIVRTPGICKKTRITVSSVAFIAEGIEVAVADASQLSPSKIQAIKRVFAG